MTIEKAFEQFAQSEQFKTVARVKDSLGGKYRMNLSRYNAGKLKAGAIIEILIANSYTISANKATKMNSSINRK